MNPFEDGMRSYILHRHAQPHVSLDAPSILLERLAPNDSSAFFYQV